MRPFAAACPLAFPTAFGFVGFAAFNDARKLHCATWPDAGNCSDARTTMTIAFLIMALSLAGALLLLRRRAT